jgi:hypothetical protein
VRRSATAAIVIVVLLAGSVRAADPDPRACREGCTATVAACVALGLRPSVCRREVRRQCRQGSELCTTERTTTGQCGVTTTTTTSTTLPVVLGPCLGAAGCGEPPSGIVHTVGSADELRNRLIGIWWDCQDPPALEQRRFGGDRAAGLEFTADGHWFFLQARDGILLRDGGFARGGTWRVTDNSVMNEPGSFLLVMETDVGTTYSAMWALAADPQQLRIDNMGVETSRYSHMPGAVACSTADRVD